MPTKERLEEINDELLAENARLYRTTERMQEMFGELKELIESRISTPAGAAAPATHPPPEGRPSPEQIARQVSTETMRQFGPVVERMGQVIAAMERAHERAEERLEEADGRQEKLTLSAEEQNRSIRAFTSLIEQARAETELLREAARRTKESFFDLIAQRWRSVLLLTAVAMTVGILAGTYAVREIMRPDQLVIEESQNWRILTYDMDGQQYGRLMGEIKAKRERILYQTDSSQSLSPEQEQQRAAEQSQQSTTGTPPAAAAPANGGQQPRTTTGGRRSRRQP